MHAETSSPSLGRPPTATQLPSDPAGFESLYRDNVRFVWRNLRRLGVPHDELEDVCQEVFVTVHRARARFEGRGAVRSWLYGILRRVASRHRRGVDRRRRRHEAYGALPQFGIAEPAVAQRLLATKLQQFLTELDPDKRDVFVLAELEELTANEISARVGVNPNTIYSRLRAARAAFEARFGPLPRQRESVRAAHRADAPTAAQKQRGWLLLMGLPLPPEAATLGRGTWGPAKLVAAVGTVAASLLVLVAVAVGQPQQASARFDRSAAAAGGVLPNPSAPSLAGLAGVGRTFAPTHGSQGGEGSAADAPGERPEAASTRPVTANGPDVATDRGPTPRAQASEARPPAPAVPSSRAGPAPPAELVAQGRAPTSSRMSSLPAPAPAPTPAPAATRTDSAPGATMRRGGDEATARPPQPARDASATNARARTAQAPHSKRTDDAEARSLLSAEETTLLRAARRALDAGDPTRALARLREHARKFPGSALAVERSASIAEAYCAKGRLRSARAHLHRLEHAGHAKLAAQIRSRCR